MGFRFRKSKSLGKFLRLNFTKNGVGFSVGPRRGGVRIGVSPKGAVNVGASDGHTGLSFTKRIGTISADGAGDDADERADHGEPGDRPTTIVHPSLGHAPTNAVDRFFSEAVEAKPPAALTMLYGVLDAPDDVREHLMSSSGFSAAEVDWFLAAFPIALRRRFSRDRTESFDDVVAALAETGEADLMRLWDDPSRFAGFVIAAGLSDAETEDLRAELLRRVASGWRPARHDDECAITGDHRPADDLVLAVVPGGHVVVDKEFAPVPA